MAEPDVDVLVVGGGIAGLTAGLFAARYGRSTVVLTGGAPGGPLLSISRIEDYPGFPEPVAGFELCPLVQEQAAAAGAAFRMDALTALDRDGDGWLGLTESSPIRARTVIAATGSKPRELGIPGEERFLGRGISHCGSCDGPLYRERTVGVIGGGDAALQEALELAEHAAQVLVFHRGAAFSGQDAYARRVLASPRIRVSFETVVDEIVGDTAVEAVVTRNVATGETSSVALAGLFPYIGTVPRTELLAGAIQLDPAGRVPTDGAMRTEAEGLFAAGDIRSDSAAHAVAAAGDGATAAAAAHAYLEGGSWAPLQLAEARS